MPNVKRDGRNSRKFDEHALEREKCLTHLRDCGMGIQEMREYLELCLQGPATILERRAILEAKRAEVMERAAVLKSCIQFIDAKQKFYDEVLAGKREYVSNLIPCSCRTEV